MTDRRPTSIYQVDSESRSADATITLREMRSPRSNAEDIARGLGTAKAGDQPKLEKYVRVESASTA